MFNSAGKVCRLEGIGGAKSKYGEGVEDSKGMRYKGHEFIGIAA